MLEVTFKAALSAEGKSCAGSCSFLCPHEDSHRLKDDLRAPHAIFLFWGSDIAFLAEIRYKKIPFAVRREELRATSAEMLRSVNHH